MRNMRWLRYGILSLVCGASGFSLAVVACGTSDNGGGGSPAKPDSGNDSTSPMMVVPGSDAQPEAEAGSAPVFAKLTLVNATTDMGPNSAIGSNGAVRVCFKQGMSPTNLVVAPFPPLPDKPSPAAPTAPPGIYYGTGGVFPSFPIDLEPRIIVPVVMNAASLYAKGFVNPGTGQLGTTCDELVGDGQDAAIGFVANKDYWELPQIDAGTFKKEKAYILALTGCVADATVANTTKCGPNFTANSAGGVGNLKIQIFETTRMPVSAAALGAQFLHVSPQTQAVFGALGANTVQPGFVSNPADGGGFKAATAAGVSYPSLSPVVAISGVSDTDYFALGQTSPVSPPQALFPYPLPIVQALSGLGLPTAPTVYKDGQNFVFVAVGDPDTAATAPFMFPDGGRGDGGDGSKFNTKFFHFVAFPTDPIPVPYKP